MTRLFITGTDTGVGKTAVACALVRRLRSIGSAVVGLKPVESGCIEGVDGRLVATDADLLRAASEQEEDNCLYRYRAALAPGVAARMEGNSVELGTVAAWVNDAAQGVDVVVVEGAGGWLVPLGEQLLVSHLAVELGYPVLVVCRPSLGTINHTVLSLRQVAFDGCQIAGFLMCETKPTSNMMLERNVAEIQRTAAMLGVDASYWGVLRHAASTSAAPVLELGLCAPSWLTTTR